MEGSCPGLVVQGRIIQGKMSWGQNSRGRLPWRNFMEKIVERETFQGIKVRKVIALGEFHRGQLSRDFFFFLSGFSFTNIHDSQNRRGRRRLFL